MAAARPRKTTFSKQSRRTRAACEQGQALVQRAEADPAWESLGEEGVVLLGELRQAVEILAMAPQLRIGAARRLQGVASRRRTAAAALFEICVDVRQRVKQHFRGPRHAALRREFGEGQPASPAKPGSVLLLARQILGAAERHGEELRRVHVRAQTLGRLRRLEEELRAAIPERGELRTAQQQISQSLVQLAARVEDLSARVGALLERRTTLPPTPDLPAVPPPVASPERKTDRT